MTLTELLDLGKEEQLQFLEVMTQEQLEAWLAPSLKFTRPDSPDAVHKETRVSGVKAPKINATKQMFLSLAPDKRKQLEELAKAQGMDLEDMIDSL